MQIEIWSVGKNNEPFIEAGLQYYFQKIRPYNSVELVIIQPSKKAATNDILQTKEHEEMLILKRLKSHHYLILLDEKGKQLSSVQWSQQIQHFMNHGTKTLVILIGGAFGVTDTIRNEAKQTWSLSQLVFPHQMVRLIASEQLYRAFSILNNSPYHHS